jgi:hypothetical protein
MMNKERINDADLVTSYKGRRKKERTRNKRKTEGDERTV